MRIARCANMRRLIISVALVTLHSIFVRQLAGEDLATVGKALFDHEWQFQDSLSPKDGNGLGPMFNARSCVACHNQGGPGGGGSNEHNVQLLSLLNKSLVDNGSLAVLGIDDRDERWARQMLPQLHSGFSTGGSVILHKFSMVRNYADLRRNLTGQGNFPQVLLDDVQVQVHRIPTRNGDLIRIGRALLQTSARNTPSLFGLGRVDAVPHKAMQQVARWQKRKYPGIQGVLKGKFGWRGQTSTLKEFVLGACANELGLTTPGHQAARTPNNDFDVTKSDMTTLHTEALINFVSQLPAPKQLKARGLAEARARIRGGRVFERVDCNACHIKNIGGVSGLYSDLLVHDMGDGLYDPAISVAYYGGGRSLELARQWKTPPLWGVRDSAPYLHDGRAATLDDAIRMHGGEAAKSRDAYVKLRDSERADMLVFVNSLGAR